LYGSALDLKCFRRWSQILTRPIPFQFKSLSRGGEELLLSNRVLLRSGEDPESSLLSEDKESCSSDSSVAVSSLSVWLKIRSKSVRSLSVDNLGSALGCANGFALTYVIPQSSHVMTTKFGVSAVTVPPVCMI